MESIAEPIPYTPFYKQPDGLRLANEITKLSAYIYAATYRLLVLLDCVLVFLTADAAAITHRPRKLPRKHANPTKPAAPTPWQLSQKPT